jgi:broad specificity phosphatase PhoE
MRHGEVENPEGVIYERLPGFHLSKTGKNHTEIVAKQIITNKETKNISVIYSSPLERAIETATPVAKLLNLPITIDNRLIEAGHKFKGKKVGKGEGSFLKIRNLWLMRNIFKPSYGESYVNIAKRMKSAVEDFSTIHPHENILVVSHQAPIWVLYRIFSGKKPQHLNFMRNNSYCSILKIRVSK